MGFVSRRLGTDLGERPRPRLDVVAVDAVGGHRSWRSWLRLCHDHACILGRHHYLPPMAWGAQGGQRGGRGRTGCMGAALGSSASHRARSAPWLEAAQLAPRGRVGWWVGGGHRPHVPDCGLVGRLGERYRRSRRELGRAGDLSRVAGARSRDDPCTSQAGEAGRIINAGGPTIWRHQLIEMGQRPQACQIGADRRGRWRRAGGGGPGVVCPDGGLRR